MGEPHLGLLIVIISLALAFGFTNGINDAANAIATSVSTRVLSPRSAVALAAICDFIGAATGLAVAKTIGKGIVDPEFLTQWTLIAGLAGVIIWSLLCTRYGLPVSLTHGLVAGLVGAGIAAAGVGAIQWHVFQRVLLAVVFAPLLGFAGGFVAMMVLTWLFRHSSPVSMRNIFSTLQILSSAFVAYSHGKNDGQMPIGVIMAGLVYYNPEVWSWDHIPLWVIAISAGSITLGTACGGWRVIRTVGMRITALRPVHGFAAQGAGAAVIEAASHLGIPVSTTHCISSSVMGVGATKRLSAVRWGVAGNMLAAWVITFPVCCGLGWLFAQIFGSFS